MWLNVNDTDLYRKLRLLNTGNQLHNHASKTPLQHIKAIMFTCKETKDKEKDVQEIHKLAICAEKCGPYLKMQYEPLMKVSRKRPRWPKGFRVG